MEQLQILVPVYNEEDSILVVLEKLNQQSNTIGSIVITVIDDGSTDKTSEILRNNSHLYSKLISCKTNLGKGKAVILGLEQIKSGYIVIQDADLEYDPRELPRLINLVEEYNADVLLTSRLSGSPITRVHYFWHKIGNIFLTLVFNLLNNTSFTDLYSGYLIFDRKLINVEKLNFYGWGQQAEIMTYLVKNSSKIFECPITYRGRTYEEGKKIRASAMLNVLAGIIITRIRIVFLRKIQN
jgi:glycosyltransferase involved in cell wall biosynthesis